MSAGLSYPVIVEYTERHIVWVEADSLDDAVAMLQDTPYEWTSSKTAVDSDFTAAAPDSYDYVEQPASAHVEAYHRHQYDERRTAEKAACAAKGHPDAHTERNRIWCPVCWSLPLVVTLAVSDVL
jgi:hypothetical protein